MHAPFIATGGDHHYADSTGAHCRSVHAIDNDLELSAFRSANAFSGWMALRDRHQFLEMPPFGRFGANSARLDRNILDTESPVACRGHCGSQWGHARSLPGFIDHGQQRHPAAFWSGRSLLT